MFFGFRVLSTQTFFIPGPTSVFNRDLHGSSRDLPRRRTRVPPITPSPIECNDLKAKNHILCSHRNSSRCDWNETFACCTSARKTLRHSYFLGPYEAARRGVQVQCKTSEICRHRSYEYSCVGPSTWLVRVHHVWAKNERISAFWRSAIRGFDRKLSSDWKRFLEKIENKLRSVIENASFTDVYRKFQFIKMTSHVKTAVSLKNLFTIFFEISFSGRDTAF